MDLVDLLEILKNNILNTSWLEVIAVFFGILSVLFALKEKILVYPTGIISVVIFIYICYHMVQLYADMGINVLYFVMSIYGWYKWSKKDENKKNLPISSCNTKEVILSLSGVLFCFLFLSFILKRFTDSTVPLWDSLTTAIFIIGMLLMAFKKIENWIAWIVGDFISIPLYFHKGLVLSSIQFTVFLVLAILGYLAWKKKLGISPQQE